LDRSFKAPGLSEIQCLTFNDPRVGRIIEIGPKEIPSMEARRMNTWMKPFALMAVLALGAAACEDGATDTDDFDDAGLRMDAALVAADGMFQDIAHMQGPAAWGGFGSGPQAMGIEIQGSTNFTRTVTFVPGPDYDPIETTEMHIVSDLTRQVSHNFWSADIVRHREMTVSGLYGEETERTWNGTATGDVFKSRHPEDEAVRTYDMESTATITEVIRALPRAENPWPISGTITRVIHVVRTEDGVTVKEKNLTTTITFNGTKDVTLVVKDGDTTEEFEIDLSERNVKKRFRRKNK
jgi:hypothetical protein